MVRAATGDAVGRGTAPRGIKTEIQRLSCQWGETPGSLEQAVHADHDARAAT